MYIKRIISWFHNHTRATTSGTGKRGVLKLGKPRLLQPWQAYQAMYYDDKMKGELTSLYDTYLSKTVAQGEKPQGRFAFINVYMKDAYKNASDEVKGKVEEYRQGSRSKLDAEDLDAREETNQALQRYVA